MARPPKLDDDEVLDRAMHVFWRQGWTATSIRQLERELDLKAPSIYRRFGSKEELARAVLERYVERVMGRRIEKYLDGAADPLGNVRRFVDSALTPRREAEPLLGCLLTVTALDGPGTTPELAELLASGLAAIEEALTSELARAHERGQLALGLDPSGVAAQLALAFPGLMVLARGGHPPDDLRARAEKLIDSFTSPDGATGVANGGDI